MTARSTEGLRHAWIAAERIRVSVGRDRLYLTVSEYESDIWMARLRW